MVEIYVEARLAVAQRAARQAAAYLAGQFETALSREVHFKGRIDLVTACDVESQRIVTAEIRRAFPGDAILSEEALSEEREAREPADSETGTWIIDPLDGTSNFVHGLPHFAVSIAFHAGGCTQVGVIADPLRGELFWATLDGGAFRDGEPIRVSATPRLDEALIASGFPYDIASTSRDNLRQWAAMARLVRSPRCLGAAALDLAWVARGRLDGHWELDLESWDMAAGALLVQEAGGMVTDAEGRPFDVFRRSILATNGALHAEALDALSR